MPNVRKKPPPLSPEFLLGDADDENASQTIQALGEKAEKAEQRAEKAEQRERNAKEETRKDRFETNKTFIIIAVALFSIAMFALGRVTSQWGDLNAELRDVRERIAVMEVWRNPPSTSSVQQKPTASPTPLPGLTPP